MNLPKLPKPWGHYPPHLQVACYTASQMREYGAACADEASGKSLDHVDAARAVLVMLGYSISPSREPGADERVDRVAGVLARYLQPNARLTAAAPDLLAALQALVAELDGSGKPYSSDSYAPPHFIETAKAAIAKATEATF